MQEQVDREDGGRQGQGYLQQQHREVAQPDLKAGFRLAIAQSEGDSPELGATTRGHDDTSRRPVAHHRPHVGDRPHVGQGRTDRHRRYLLDGGHRLTRQHALDALEHDRLHHAEVGWHHLAEVQPYHVSRHQRRHLHRDGQPIPKRDRVVPDP